MPGEGVTFPRTAVTGGCEPQGGCWELNPGPLKEQPVLLRVEPSLIPKLYLISKSSFVL